MTSNESTVHTQDIFLDWEKKLLLITREKNDFSNTVGLSV